MLADKIGVFGGSFNPVHLGHLVLAQDALESFELDSVLFIPCGNPSHKDLATFASHEHRLAMLQRVIELEFRFEVSDVEVTREGTSYMIDTLEELQADFPGEELVFIVGSDTLTDLFCWHRIDELLHRHRIIAPVRPGYEVDRLKAMDFQLEEGWKEKLLENVISGHQIEISSSEIRMRVAEGMSIRYLVPSEVEMYIYEHGLYKG